jgi:hypothetical protein
VSSYVLAAWLQIAPQTGPSISDYLAVAALVLAIVTLVLDFTFFVLSSLALQRSEREQHRVFTEMREVLDHIEERAQLVQEQVNTQTAKLIDVIAARASNTVEVTGDEVSAELQTRIDAIDARLAGSPADNGAASPVAIASGGIWKPCARRSASFRVGSARLRATPSMTWRRAVNSGCSAP